MASQPKELRFAFNIPHARCPVPRGGRDALPIWAEHGVQGPAIMTLQKEFPHFGRPINARRPREPSQRMAFFIFAEGRTPAPRFLCLS
jgi:hypothetical protein